MTNKKRLPTGEVIDVSNLESGVECGRCGEFISTEPAEEPKPEVQRYRIESEGFASTSNSNRHHTTAGGPENVDDTLCPDCQESLKRFMNNYLVEPTEASDE